MNNARYFSLRIQIFPMAWGLGQPPRSSFKESVFC